MKKVKTQEKEILAEDSVSQVCGTCHGSGRVMSTPIASVSCETCSGTGK